MWKTAKMLGTFLIIAPTKQRPSKYLTNLEEGSQPEGAH